MLFPLGGPLFFEEPASSHYPPRQEKQHRLSHYDMESLSRHYQRFCLSLLDTRHTHVDLLRKTLAPSIARSLPLPMS